MHGLKKRIKRWVNINDRGAAFSNSTLVHPDEMSVWLDKCLSQSSLLKESAFQQFGTLGSGKQAGDDSSFLREANAAARRGAGIFRAAWLCSSE